MLFLIFWWCSRLRLISIVYMVVPGSNLKGTTGARAGESDERAKKRNDPTINPYHGTWDGKIVEAVSQSAGFHH